MSKNVIFFSFSIAIVEDSSAMAAKSGIRRKSIKSARGKSLVRCGKCRHTARNHFNLRRHSAKYHLPNTRKFKRKRSNRSRQRRSNEKNRVSSREKLQKPSFRLGSLVVLSDDNLEIPPTRNKLASVRSKSIHPEDVRQPRKVYSRKPKACEPQVSSSGRVLRSSRCYSDCCSVKAAERNVKPRSESMKSASDTLEQDSNRLKSKDSCLKSNIDNLRSGSGNIDSKRNCLKSKSGSVKSKRVGLKSASGSAKSRSDDLKSKSGSIKSKSDGSKLKKDGLKLKSELVKSESLESDGENSTSESGGLKRERSNSKRGSKTKKREKNLIPLPCNLCSYIGRDSYNLRRHMQNKHEPKPPKTPKIYQCEQCEYKNRYRFLVKRHSAVHSRDRKGGNRGESGFACDKCDYVSASACNLKRHQHCRHEKVKEAKLQCSLCDHREPDRPALFGHFQSAHGVIIESERLEFDDFQSFMAFKLDIEKSTLARFVRQQTRMGEKKLVIFKCHRDGIFRSKSHGQRKRALKTTGSNKINSACPASMRLTIYPSSKVSVVFTKTHVGHSNEVCRLTLTKEEKLLIGEMLESKRSFMEILCEIRSGMDSERLERIHLLSRKDLQNIEKWYKTRDVEEGPRITMDIDIAEWVDKIQETGVVRLYKKPASFLPKPFKCLEYDEFVLILANDLQLAMLREYGSECICVDNAFENAQVKLTSLMVLDDRRQGFPCAFMLSSKIDRVIMKVFLDVVKKESGCPLTPLILVSDIPDCRRTEWSAVMDLPESTEVFYSPWSIEDDLNRNLLKVKNDAERQEVYKLVKNLITDSTSSEVQNAIGKTLKFLDENPCTHLFGKYFRSKFADTAPKWAHCFANRLHADYNHPLSSTHDIIKLLYSEGQKNEKLVDCINVFMAYVRDQLQDWIVLGERICPDATEGSGDEMARLKDSIAKRHGDAEEMKTRPVDSGVYEIVEHNLQCRCGLRCSKCETCIHSYRCTCNDSVLGWTVCRHIHFCVMSNAEQEPSVTIVGQPFDPLEEKRKLLLEFENMCDDIAADESVGEVAEVEFPVIDELPREADSLKGNVEHCEQLPEEQLQHSQEQQQQEEEEEGQKMPVVDTTGEVPTPTPHKEEQPSTVETGLEVELEVKPPMLQQQQQQPREFEDAKSKLHQRFQSICQLMSSDVDVTLIEQALASIENAIASKRTSTQE